MKKHIVFLFLSLVIISCQEDRPRLRNKDLLPATLVNNPRSAEGTDTSALGKLATMDFKDTVFNFGTIKEGEVVTHDFEFKNNGKNVLIISNYSASCGCTVADFPKEPMAPGKTGVVKVQFSSVGKQGHQGKSIALVTNSNKGTYLLIVEGEVTPEKD